ncbi:F-box protein interaction domain protein [Medicago truncatula]|uniref:F-box protein interaction domain protein n=1 Tax=Medicago truncatula TaxID=3880 RepID=A0A072UB98_MEDTR|nr:F-box protein interaction domain protein [Medicago truncatula]
MEKKKPVSTTKKNEIVSTQVRSSSTYISDDIAFSILSKLPLKSFKRVESVRKSWSLLSEDTHFMNMFRNNFLSSNSYYDGASLFLKVTTWPDMQQMQVLYTLSGHRFQNIVNSDFSNPFKHDRDFQIFGFGSINGTLLLHQRCCYRHALWHPSTKKYKILPPSQFESYILDDVKRYYSIVCYIDGFGCDCVTDDYQVIRYIFFADPNNDLRSNSWRILDVDMPPSLDTTEGNHVYMDGVCHWLCQKDYGYWKKHNISFQPSLVSFYLSNEVFFITPIPSDVDVCFDVETNWRNFFKGTNWRNLAVLNGTIALFSYHEKKTTFQISILGEIGMKESWTKLFTMGPLPCVDRPIGVGMKGEIFFIRKDKELAWFDLSTQMIEELGFKVDRPGCRITIYKESILPFEGINNYLFFLFLPTDI